MGGLSHDPFYAHHVEVMKSDKENVHVRCDRILWSFQILCIRQWRVKVTIT